MNRLIQIALIFLTISASLVNAAECAYTYKGYEDVIKKTLLTNNTKYTKEEKNSLVS